MWLVLPIDTLFARFLFGFVNTKWIATSTALYLAHALVSDPAEEWSLYRWLEYFVSDSTHSPHRLSERGLPGFLHSSRT